MAYRSIGGLRAAGCGAGTLCARAGVEIDGGTGAVAPLICTTKTYQQTFGEPPTYDYRRGRNPTREQCERAIACLEGGKHAVSYASGVGAIHALLSTMKAGDHVLFTKELYGGTYRQLNRFWGKLGLEFGFADLTEPDEIRGGITKDTRLIFAETPTNPLLNVVDMEMLHGISHAAGVPFAVDSTFATPLLLRPLEYGAHAVVQSLSKFISGHNDVIGGAVITNDDALNEELKLYERTNGAVLSPDDAYRTLQGMKTLELRMERMCGNAMEVAHFLEGHPAVGRVYYPGLCSHPQHELAGRQMGGRYGALVSFELDLEPPQIAGFVNNLGLIIYGESLGSTETLLAYPPTMSHGSVPPDERRRMGIGDGLFRISCGIEDASDIMGDLSQALEAAAGAGGGGKL